MLSKSYPVISSCSVGGGSTAEAMVACEVVLRLEGLEGGGGGLSDAAGVALMAQGGDVQAGSSGSAGVTQLGCEG